MSSNQDDAGGDVDMADSTPNDDSGAGGKLAADVRSILLCETESRRDQCMSFAALVDRPLYCFSEEYILLVPSFSSTLAVRWTLGTHAEENGCDRTRSV
jgi:hypothetical protein